MTDTALTGELLALRYVTLDDALSWLWGANPKQHDLAQLAASIRQYGFRDPSIFDGELNAISAGNGRLQALAQIRDADEEAPRGVGLGADGTWHVPIIFGVDAASQIVAMQFAVDHNNLTFAGFSAEEIARAWQQSDYLALLKRLQAEDALPVTVTDDDVATLALLQRAARGDASPGDPGEDRYQEQYGVIVICDDEAHQEQVYNALKDEGYDVRVVVT